jgi:hypothetical protein
MLSDEEKTFLEYWEKNREKEKKSFKQLMIGLPLGLLFAFRVGIRAPTWLAGHSSIH